MKKYSRIAKKHVTPEEYDRIHSTKDKDFCKGKKPHDFVLVLPHYVTYDETYKHNPLEYYKLKAELEDFEDAIDKKVRALGVVERTFRISRLRRKNYLFICSVCKKQEYGETPNH